MKKVLVLSLALILLLGITSHGTSSYFSDTETSAGNTFTAWVEEVLCAKFNVSDKDTKVYKYDDSGSFVDSFNLSGDNEFPVGVASVGDYVYVIDHADKQVYQYTCSGAYVDVSRKLLKAGEASSIGNIDGLAIDIVAGEMWVLSGNKKNIYQYSLSAAFPDDGSSLKAAIEIPLDNQGAAGLAIDSTYLYVLDYDTSQKETRFYRYPYPAGTPVVASKVLKDVNGGDIGGPPGGLAGAMYDGTNNILWVVDQDTDKIYGYDVTNLFNGNGSINADFEFDLHTENTDATGM